MTGILLARHARGFTLIELLVALGIFALVSALAYGGLAQIMESRDRINAQRVFWRSASMLFRQMDEDLRQARNRPIVDQTGAPVEAFRGRPVDSRALGEPSLDFTRGGLPVTNLSPRSDLQRIGYRLHEGKLYRLAWPSLDRAPTAKPHEAALLADVEDFSVRFYDAKTAVWHDEWPPLGQTQATPLPRGVEVRLRLKGAGEFTRLYLVGAP